MIGEVQELIIQGSYSKNHYKKLNKGANWMISTKSKPIGGGEAKEGHLSKREQLQILYQDSCNKGITSYPSSLLSKGENVQRFPSMPKGENVECGCH